jgi:DNA mismatch repair protein MutL
MTIHVLADDVVAQIAAGEVVERPASVVKELIENALDAGASSIHVEMVGGGQRRMRVSDDGSGILADEVEVAFSRHATSKLRTADDLSHIETLGFRGEALSSIVSVSRTSVVTRHREETAGTRLQIEGSALIQRQSVGAPVGTVITVDDLFFNTPARLKFLKSENTEKRQVVKIVTRYAMAYPHVRFILEQDGREVFRSSGSGSLADVIVKALGLDNFKNMVEVSGQETGRGGSTISVYGYTSMPGLHRTDRTRIILFVNGRSIQDSSLTYAVVQAYHTLLMNGRYPVSALMIDLPPDEVDVNVHPTKAEVRFRDANAVFVAVQRAVRTAVVAQSQSPHVRSGYFAPTGDVQPSSGWGESMESATQLDMDLTVDEPGQYATHRASLERMPVDDDSTAIPSGPGAPSRPRTLPVLRVVGQVGATYIVAEGPAGLYLIDQHAAHERILYEQFMEEHSRHDTIAQHTLEAQVIDLPPAEARLLEENLDSLQAIGISLESFGPNTFTIRSVPAMLADADPMEVISGIVEDLEQGKKPGHESVEDKIVIRVCKQAAVKAGQILSMTEMQGLIRQLERCQSPHTCPHGRPTILHMTSDQLAREFGRIH